MHLLHLSLLHASAAPTLEAWTDSAYDDLEGLHRTLKELYVHVLQLERQARQAANVLALCEWTKGNVNSMSRRLNVLCGVLKEVMILTAPGSRKVRVYRVEHDAITHPDDTTTSNTRDAEAPSQPPRLLQEPEYADETVGSYAHLIASFTSWTSWVKEIWAARAAAAASSIHLQAPHTTTPTPTPNKSPSPTAASITPIDALGDSLKSSLRTLITSVNSLLLRLDELPPFPASSSSSEEEEIAATSSTPSRMLSATRALVQGMKEELQLVREIEYEVVAGEEGWMRMRGMELAGGVEGGWGTPVR